MERVRTSALVLLGFLLSLSGGLVEPRIVTGVPPAITDYTAWVDVGIVYDATPSDAYYPSVIYDANGFGSGTPLYKMWYSNGLGQVFVVSSTNGLSWGSPALVTGLSFPAHHVQVVYDANCFGVTPCGPGSIRYKIWYWHMLFIYDIRAIRYAESADGVTWSNDQAITQGSPPLVTGGPVGWNRGSYGPIYVIYRPGAPNTGTDPWNYSYVMYYDGTNGANEFTGLAYSSDGKAWTAYSTAPVLSGSTSAAWDCSDTAYGTVYRDVNGFHFWYSGGGADNGSGGCLDQPVHQGIGYAWSPDGKTWTKHPSPIFHITTGPSYRNVRVYTPAVVDDGSSYLKMYYSAQGTGTKKKIGLALLFRPPEANLRITKVAPAVVNVAQAFTYVIEVRNLGPWDAADVSVSDPVPEGAIVTSVSGAGWTCGVSGDVVTCHRPVLAAGASAPPIFISVRAPALGGFVLNTATVSSAVTDPTMGNNTSTAETELIHQDLAAFAVHSLRGAASGIPVEGVLVVTSGEDQVRVFLNRGDGTFVLKQRLSVGRGPVAVAVGDLTGDGITDAVTANLRGRSLTLLQGEGDGTFRKGRTLSVEGQPWALALADVDRDGRGDLVLAYGDRDAVQILTGRGEGTFRAGRRYPVGRRPSSLAVADLNHDGWLDLVVANSGAHSLTLLFGQGAGTFTPVTVEVGKNPLRVAVGDLDGDGRPEIVVTHYREAALSIVALRSRGEQAWTAQPVRALPTGEGPIGIAFGRFSPEAVSLACVGAIAEEVWIYGAEGRSPLSLRQRLPTSAPVSLVTGDVNGDGRQDLILLDVGGRLSVWFSTEEGRLHRRQ
jgi:uncharacterized repeat protein (TIGR01451 family)